MDVECDQNVCAVDAADVDYNILEVDDDELGDDVCENVERSGRYEIDQKLPIRDQLARWAVYFAVSGVALSALLKILVLYGLMTGLPTDSRSLLKTARQVTTKRISGGEYFHFGIAEGIIHQLKALKASVFNKLGNVLKVVISSDGLPVFKSVNTHVWPISGALFVDGKCAKPFVIGVFYGVDKLMEVGDFLHDFVLDFRSCSTDGFLCRERRFTIDLHCIVADAPARAFMKNVKGHGAHHGCERCTVIGVKLKGETFNREDAPRRTDASLLDTKEKEHRKGPSPLSTINVKLVTHFVLDYMHLVLLGVTRRLLYLWVEGEKNERIQDRKYRISQGAVRILSDRFTSFIESCPKEFARKPRSLVNFRMFKATEFRTMLLYTGVVAFKSHVIKRNVYQNFLLLSCAMRIYLSSVYCKDRAYRKHARIALKRFVEHYREIYGASKVVYNVHNLIHLHNDSKIYGNLESVSAFPFENFLQTFKRMIRHGHHTMQQLIRRLDEQRRYTACPEEMFPSETKKRYLHQHNFDLPPTLARYQVELKAQYKAVEYGSKRYSIFDADSCIRLQNGSVGKIVNIMDMQDGETLLAYRQYKYRRPFFNYPMDSEAVGISEVRELTPYLLVTPVERCAKAWLMHENTSSVDVAIDLIN